jgi:hypothetical protein
MSALVSPVLPDTLQDEYMAKQGNESIRTEYGALRTIVNQSKSVDSASSG